MFVLFPLHIRSKHQECASYVNTDKRNGIHTSTQTQRIKFKEGSVSQRTKFAKEKFKIKSKICKKKVRKTHCCLNLTTVTFENYMSMISVAI